MVIKAKDIIDETISIPCIGHSADENTVLGRRISDGVKPDMVNHPPHYNTSSGLETIDVIEAFTDGLNGVEASDTANIIKYACRWKHKNGIEDLKKIVWYANHLIGYLEKQ